MDLTLTYMGLNFRKKLWSYFILLKKLEVCMCEGVCVLPSIFYTLRCLLSFAFVLLTIIKHFNSWRHTTMHCWIINIVKSRMLWGKITKAQLVHTHSYNLYAETAHICEIWVNPFRRKGRTEKGKTTKASWPLTSFPIHL